jgi:hypothetical protein
VALAQSRLRHDLFPREYATTRARHAINLKAMRTDDIALWAFTMLPVGQLVSRVPALLRSFDSWGIVVIWSFTHPPAGDGCERRTIRPAHAPSPSMRARRSGGSKSGRRVRRRGVSGDGSAGNGGVRSSGCASSSGSPPLGLRSTRRRTTRRRRAMGYGLPPRDGSLRPLAQSRGGGEGNDAWGGGGSARRQAAYRRGSACRGGIGTRRGDGWG